MKHQDNRLVFAVASCVLCALMAIASFGVELVDVAGSDYITISVYSDTLAYVFLLFLFISLINSFNMITYALGHQEDPFNKNNNSE